MNATIAALDAHTAMSTQALDSEAVRAGLKDVLIDPAGLYEKLQAKSVEDVGGVYSTESVSSH